MISDLAIARAAFAGSRTPTDALLAVAQARLKVDNAAVDAKREALKTGGAPDIEAAQQAILDNLAAKTVDKTA
ncbi:MAG: hypothetical protein P4M09_24690 [Devosia sp.]|nr:hypothetical protein [Devosia sp.]